MAGTWYIHKGSISFSRPWPNPSDVQCLVLGRNTLSFLWHLVEYYAVNLLCRKFQEMVKFIADWDELEPKKQWKPFITWCGRYCSYYTQMLMPPYPENRMWHKSESESRSKYMEYMAEHYSYIMIIYILDGQNSLLLFSYICMNIWLSSMGHTQKIEMSVWKS